MKEKTIYLNDEQFKVLSEALSIGLNGTGRSEKLLDEDVDFGNGTVVSIQVFAGENENEAGWSQAVLFIDGQESDCSNVYDYIKGCFTVGDYKVNVDHITNNPYYLAS